MDKERYALTNELYNVANDKFKVDDWIKSLGEEKEISEQIYANCLVKYKKLHEEYQHLNDEEKMESKEFNVKAYQCWNELVQFNMRMRSDFETGFKLTDLAYEDRKGFDDIYLQFTKDFKG